MSIPKTIPATQLKRLGTRLPTFDMPVTIPVVGGEAVKLTLTVNALRKTEWGKIRDDLQKAAMVDVLGVDVTAAPAAQTKAPPRKRAGAKTEKAAAETPAAEATKDIVSSALDKIMKNGHEANIRQGIQRDVSLVLKFATGWDLEDDFSEDNLSVLEDEFGGAVAAIINAYDLAIFQGRLGN